MKRALQVEDRRIQQIRKLTDVSRAITYAATLEEVFQLTVTRAADLLAAGQSFLLVAGEDGLLVLRSSHGIDAELAQRFQEPLSEALVPRLAEFFDAPTESFIVVPLVVAGAVKGVLVVIRPALSGGEEQDEWLLSSLADQAAAALEKTRLDEVGEFREMLIGIVGHDLRNPLSTILMASHLLLLRKGLGEEETGQVRIITSSAMQAARLIDQLLDLTRSRLGGGIPIDPQRCDLNEIVRQVLGEIELTHPDRPLHRDIQGDLMGVWDRDRMYQLLANLVGNAANHGEPRSTIELRIDGRQSEVIIEVGNRGVPIPPAILPFIFDAFRRGRTGLPSRTHGLGLGLFIAQQIARSHGGSITAKSSEQDGTVFRVGLPRGPASRAA